MRRGSDASGFDGSSLKIARQYDVSSASALPAISRRERARARCPPRRTRPSSASRFARRERVGPVPSRAHGLANPGVRNVTHPVFSDTTTSVSSRQCACASCHAEFDSAVRGGRLATIAGDSGRQLDRERRSDTDGARRTRSCLREHLRSASRWQVPSPCRLRAPSPDCRPDKTSRRCAATVPAECRRRCRGRSSRRRRPTGCECELHRAAVRGELERVRQQVAEHLVDPIEVPVHLVGQSVVGAARGSRSRAARRARGTRARALRSRSSSRIARGSRRPPPASNRLTSSSCFTRRSSVFACTPSGFVNLELLLA